MGEPNTLHDTLATDIQTYFGTMDRNRPTHSSYNQDSAMYDDQPYAAEYRGSSSQGYQTWKGNRVGYRA